MAQSSDTKLYVALLVLAGLGGALYVQQKDHKEDADAHSFSKVQSKLPKLEFTEEAMKKVTKLVIIKPGTDAKEGTEAEPPAEHVLIKEGETWNLAGPVRALANQKNVESLLENLTKVEVKEEIASGAASYEGYDLTDDKAVHVQAFEGDKVVFELWAGKSGGRGQTARLPKSEAIYTVDGFSPFMAKRDTKGWRDLKITEVPTDSVKEISIAGEAGTFLFEKKDDKWSGNLKKSKSPVAAPIKDFDPAKVEDMLRAYKTLNATGFGDGKSLEEVGLAEPTATVVFKAGTETKLLFGSNSEGSARWAKLEGNDQIYAVSSWAADWAVAGEEKFQKKAEEKPEEE